VFNHALHNHADKTVDILERFRLGSSPG
jgi:hypothetical protein